MSAASASRKKSVDEITTPARPIRAMVMSRKLPRTESPTSSAPASTDTAAATPATTARFVRQWWRVLRAIKRTRVMALENHAGIRDPGSGIRGPGSDRTSIRSLWFASVLPELATVHLEAGRKSFCERRTVGDGHENRLLGSVQREQQRGNVVG